VLVVATAVALSSLLSTVVAGAIHQFPDVPAEHPFHDDIAWLSHIGITEGYGDGTYRPADPVTRGSMAAFLRRNFEATDDRIYTTEEVTGPHTASGTGWQQLPGSMIEFSVPDGTGATILATFSAESVCTGAAGFCSARIMVDDPATGLPGPVELGTDASGFAFDSTENGAAPSTAWGAHSIQRTDDIRTPSETWTAWVEVRTSVAGIDFRVDDWLHSLHVDIVGLNT
jgi:hypothetical protein